MRPGSQTVPKAQEVQLLQQLDFTVCEGAPDSNLKAIQVLVCKPTLH